MKIKITLNRPKWLGDDAGCLYKTVTVTESTANYVIDNGRKIIPSGTLIVTPKVSGLLVNDCDVTDGERVAQILVRGGYIDSKLPTSVEGSKTLLSNQGLFAVKYAETVIPSGDNGGGNAGGGSGVSGDLTPFRVGQTIKGVTIDPNAKSVDEIANWLNGLSEGTEFVVSETESTYNSIVYIRNFAGAKTLSSFESDSIALFFTEAVSAEGITAQKGWYNYNDKTKILTPMAEKTTINSGAYVLTTVSPEFAFLNGVVVGAVEA